MLRAEKKDRLMDRVLRRLGLVRLAHVEIVSEEMIDGGFEVFTDHDDDEECPRAIVRNLFLKMLALGGHRSNP